MVAVSERAEQVLYDILQSAEVLRISSRTVAALLASGDLSSVTIGRRRLIPRQAIDAFVAARIAAAGVPSDDAA